MTHPRHLVNDQATLPRVRGLALAGLTGLVLATLIHAPASWFVPKRFQDPRGSIWQGSAQVGLPSRLHWNMTWTHQGLWPALQLRIHADCCTREDVQARATWTLDGLAIDLPNQSSNWPASWLTTLGAPWNTLQPQGQLAIQTQQVRWLSSQPETFSGDIRVQLQEFSTQLSTLRPLGSYELLIQGGGTPSLALTTLEGALRLSGQGQWANRRFRFQGEASAQEGHEAALSNLLNVLGQRRGKISVLNMS